MYVLYVFCERKDMIGGGRGVGGGYGYLQSTRSTASSSVGW